MSSPAGLIKDMLVTAGVGTFGTDLFVGIQPATPDACVTLFDSGGRNPDPKHAHDEPSVQAMVRSAVDDYEGGWAKAQAVKDALLGAPVTGDVRGVLMRGDVNHLGRDDQARHEWSLNFRLSVVPATAGHRTVI